MSLLEKKKSAIPTCSRGKSKPRPARSRTRQPIYRRRKADGARDQCARGLTQEPKVRCIRDIRNALRWLDARAAEFVKPYAAFSCSAVVFRDSQPNQSPDSWHVARLLA